MCSRIHVLARHVSMLRRSAAVCLFPVAIRPKRRRRVTEGTVGIGARTGFYALRCEVPNRAPILGERPLYAVLAEYQAHYTMARPHQGIAQHVPEGEHDSRQSAGAPKPASTAGGSAEKPSSTA
jgi:hypothetical protein